MSFETFKKQRHGHDEIPRVRVGRAGIALRAAALDLFTGVSRVQVLSDETGRAAIRQAPAGELRSYALTRHPSYSQATISCRLFISEKHVPFGVYDLVAEDDLFVLVPA